MMQPLNFYWKVAIDLEKNRHVSSVVRCQENLTKNKPVQEGRTEKNIFTIQAYFSNGPFNAEKIM